MSQYVMDSILQRENILLNLIVLCNNEPILEMTF